MTPHRKILPEVIEQFGRTWPECRIVMHGSVLRGNARPDSDLDLIIIRDEGGGRETVHSQKHDGVTLCLTFYGAAWLKQHVHEKPHWYWPLSIAEVHRDPDGFVAGVQERLGVFFDANPKVAAAWQRASDQYVGKKTDPDIELEFQDWGALFAHIENDLMP